jgi:hypothetical protein
MTVRSALLSGLSFVAAVYCAGCTRESVARKPPDSRADDSASASSGTGNFADAATAVYANAPEEMRIDASESFASITERIARRYKSWTRVSDDVGWALTDCAYHPPSGVLRSESNDQSTHGQKLYFLFANIPSGYRHDRYVRATGEPVTGIEADQPIGQAIVKEAWRPAACDSPAPHRLPPAEYIFRDGRWYRTGEPAGLFIMFKLDPATPETDRGWVYATSDPNSGAATKRADCELHEVP